jgi:CBS domain-containing protein
MIRFKIVPDVIDGTGAATIPATATVGEVARKLAGGDADALAVIDDENGLSGLIDANGIVLALAEAGAAALGRPVAAVARPAHDILAPGDSGLDALEMMRLRAVDHLPVMDAAGCLLGIVSRRRLCEILHRCLDNEFDRQAADVFGASAMQPGELP